MKRMKKGIVVFSGFTEERDRLTGSHKLWRKIFNKYKDDISYIFLLEWDEDPKGYAEFLNSLGVTHVLVYAYSWGAGFGLREFSKSFKGKVEAVLCDPVFRSKYPWMRWRALTKKWKPTIKYSQNVTVRKWFNQTKNQPGADNVETRCKVETLPYLHSEIDDSPEYQQAALKEAHSFVNGN